MSWRQTPRNSELTTRPRGVLSPRDRSADHRLETFTLTSGDAEETVTARLLVEMPTAM